MTQPRNRIIEEDVPSRYGGTYPRRTLVLTCCGLEIECRNHTNTCDRCGADYNSGGQRLAPREFWGEETGEHWSECL